MRCPKCENKIDFVNYRRDKVESGTLKKGSEYVLENTITNNLQYTCPKCGRPLYMSEEELMKKLNKEDYVYENATDKR